MFTTRYPWGSTAALLCAVLLQDCQSSSLSITEEGGAVASSASLASVMRQRASGELPATSSLTLPSSPPTAYIPPSRFSTTPANEQNLSIAPCSHLPIPAAAPSVLATVGNAPTAPHDLQLVAMPRAPHAASLGNTLGRVPFLVFTTASGGRVRFSQVDGQWQAVVQDGSSAYTTQRTLPVVGPGDIGGFLLWLQGQDKWASRARVHLLRMPQAPYSPCVYLGRVGLLGGMPTSPSQGSRTASQKEWIQGPTMILSGNEKRTEVYHIPAGYCYKGYRTKDGSVVKRASCTIRYVEANSKEEIDRLEGYNDGSALEAGLSADFAQVMNLGTVGAGIQSNHGQGFADFHRSSSTHAALVLYGSTKQNKMFREKSHLKLELEILVVPDAISSPNSSSMPPSFSDGGSQASQVAGAAATEIASALPGSSASASVFSPSIFSDSQPVAQPVGPVPAPVEEPDIDLGQVHQVPDLLARKLADPGKEWLAEEEAAGARLAAQQKAEEAKQAELQSKIDLLSRQYEDEEQDLQSLRIPGKAFGAKEWEKYFGDVGAAPALPSDIGTILDSACPFWSGKKVRNTHLLVLIPASVDGAPFTLNLLGELIQRPKNGGHKTEYRYYNNNVKTQFGAVSPDHSYWLLMTRDVLEGSRGKAYSAQRELVAIHARRTGQPYEVPGALEAATAILMHYARTGERLFSDYPRTFTRCQELVDGKYSVLVGGFKSSGLFVSSSCHANCNFVVSGCRRFF